MSMATTFIGPDGYEYSATTPRQEPRSRGTQSINPLGDVMAILGAMQGNRTPRYASDAIQATAAANAGLFPLRQDPRKTARINERRREMNVTEQRGRTQGQRRRDTAYRQQAIDANKAKTKARGERAAARAEQERIDANRRYQDTVGPSDAMISAERDARSAAAAASQRAMEDRVVGGMTPDEATLAAQDIIAAYDRNVAELSAGGDVIPTADYDIAYPEFAAREAGIAPPSPTMRDLGYVPLGDASRQAHQDLYRGQPTAGQRDGGPYSDQLRGGGPYSEDLNPLAMLPNYGTGQTLADYDLAQAQRGLPAPIPSEAYGTSNAAGPSGSPYATGSDPTPMQGYNAGMTYEPPIPAQAYGTSSMAGPSGSPYATGADPTPMQGYNLGSTMPPPDPRYTGAGRTPEQEAQLQIDLDRARAMSLMGAKARIRAQYDRASQGMNLRERGIQEVMQPGVARFAFQQGSTPEEAVYRAMMLRGREFGQPMTDATPPYYLQRNPLRSIPVPSTNYFGGAPMQIPMAPRRGMTLGGGY